MYDGPMEIVEYKYASIWCMLDLILSMGEMRLFYVQYLQYLNGSVVLSKSEIQCIDQGLLPGGESMNLLFNSNIVNLPLKINGGGCRKPNFVILPIGALEVSAGGWWWRDGQGFI